MTTGASDLHAIAAARTGREFRGLVRSYDRALASLERDPAELFERVPGVSGWSVAEHRFHLALASELVVRNLRSLAKGEGRFVAPDGDPIPEALPILARGRLPRGERAPRMVTPPDEFDADFLHEILESGREGLLRLEPALEGFAASAATIPHQTLGPLTAPLWLRFGRMHALHHEGIMAEIDRARASAG